MHLSYMRLSATLAMTSYSPLRQHTLFLRRLPTRKRNVRKEIISHHFEVCHKERRHFLCALIRRTRRRAFQARFGSGSKRVAMAQLISLHPSHHHYRPHWDY